MAGFMKLQVYRVPCAGYAPVTGGLADVLPCEIGDANDKLQRVSDTAERWFARYSAPGYMDATDPVGPHDTAREAARECFKLYGAESYEGDPSPDEIELREILAEIES